MLIYCIMWMHPRGYLGRARIIKRSMWSSPSQLKSSFQICPVLIAHQKKEGCYDCAQQHCIWLTDGLIEDSFACVR